ncbi:MAG: hypothetical protein ACOH1V_09000 [Stenotrophomonas sp.]
MASEQRHRRVFLLLVVLLGLPTVIVGGLSALLGAGAGRLFGAWGSIETSDAAFLLGWGALGVCGLVGGAPVIGDVVRRP